MANAQSPTSRTGQASAVTGIVYDSIAQHPLASARVELVNADNPAAPSKSIETDTLGRFRFDDVAPGRYLIGFLHPILDSIGVERAPRALKVNGKEPAIRIDLALPSPQSLRTAICGTTAVKDSASLIIGVVRDAGTREAVPSSIVDVRWADFVLGSGGLRRNTEHRTFVTQETGWYSLCGAPAGGSIVLSASHDAERTEALELEMPSGGFLRRDLYFGVAHSAQDDSTVGGRPAVADTLISPATPRRTGDGRLSGVVVTAAGGRTLPGSSVTISNGPQARSDANGAFSLSGIPTGTRMLEVRAVGYSPLVLPVDVVDGALPLRLALVSLKAVLDTVKVRANLLGNRDMEGFDRRRKHSGANGRFMTTEDIARRNPVEAADIFRSMPGILIARDPDYKEILAQRNFFINLFNGGGPFCRVSVFVNGIRLNDPTVDALNGYLRVNTLLGIEVYSGATAPPEFSKRDGCGSVVIWTK